MIQEIRAQELDTDQFIQEKVREIREAVGYDVAESCSDAPEP